MGSKKEEERTENRKSDEKGVGQSLAPAFQQRNQGCGQTDQTETVTTR